MLTRCLLRKIERRTQRLRKTYVGCKVWLQEASTSTWSMSNQHSIAHLTGVRLESYKKSGIVIDIFCDPVLKEPHKIKILMDEKREKGGDEQDDGCDYISTSRKIAKKQRLTAEELLTHGDERVRKLVL